MRTVIIITSNAKVGASIKDSSGNVISPAPVGGYSEDYLETEIPWVSLSNETKQWLAVNHLDIDWEDLPETSKELDTLFDQWEQWRNE